MFDYTIARDDDWSALRPELIVDPMIYRAGEIFLSGRSHTNDADELWDALSKDLGGLVNFFDLLILHDELPAFNYTDTFDNDRNFGDSLLSLVNRRANVIRHVDVRADVYMRSKAAALDVLQQRAGDGSNLLVPLTLQENLISELSALEYRWNPSLGELEDRFEGPAKTTAKFLLGNLLFSTYAQQTGAPHIMSPKRSRLFTASSLFASHGGFELEEELYGDLARRFREGGDGWRDRDLPWTPSFLPWLLQDVDPFRLRPVDVLDKVLDLREKNSVIEYRRVRAAALGGNDDAFNELTSLADSMTGALQVDLAELGKARNVLVELLPQAVGGVGGAAVGAVGGSAGAAVGALLGIAADEGLRHISGKVWGSVFERLPFMSARKLLVRAVRAEHDSMSRLERDLRIIWGTA